MKWMIASDIHGSAYYCEKLLAAYQREQADRLLLLGDLLYHGPRNDLPEGYAPKRERLFSRAFTPLRRVCSLIPHRSNSSTLIPSAATSACAK